MLPNYKFLTDGSAIASVTYLVFSFNTSSNFISSSNFLHFNKWSYSTKCTLFFRVNFKNNLFY